MNHRHDVTERAVSAPVITLLTDFGLEDEYVGVMKGVILSLCPDARIIDISHHVAPQNVSEGAFMLHSAIRYFPAGSIHIAVVDPGVGTSRSIVAIQTQSHVFLAPDNGLLTLILGETPIDQAVCVDPSRHGRIPVSRTFHGRDVFAPAAAHLACGIDFASLGPAVDPRSLLRLPLERAHITDGGDLAGSVIHIDRFGNLITNIDRHLLNLFSGSGPAAEVEIMVGRHIIHGISNTYSDATPGRLMAVIGSREVLEIAVNQGDAADRIGAKTGHPVLARKVKSGKTVGTH